MSGVSMPGVSVSAAPPRLFLFSRLVGCLLATERTGGAGGARPVEAVRAFLGSGDLDTLAGRLQLPDHRVDQRVRQLVVAAGRDEERRDPDRVGVGPDRMAS